MVLVCSASVVVRKKKKKSLVARKQQQQQSSVWKCIPLTTDRHCCHAIVFKLASEQETDQKLDGAAKIRSASAAHKCRRLLARHLHYVCLRTFQLYVHCSYPLLWRARQTKRADMPVLLDYKTNLLRPLYNAPILQTTDFCSESQTKTEDIAGLMSPISSKPQLQTIQDYILWIITVYWSVYCSGPPALIGYTALTSTSVALAYPVDYSRYA